MALNLLTPAASHLEDGTTGGWVDYANGSTITNSTTYSAEGSHCLKAVSSAAADLGLSQPYGANVVIPATAGNFYSAMASFRADATPRTCQVFITWYDSAKAAITDSASGSITSTTTGFTQATVTNVQAPANTCFMTIRVLVTAVAISEIVYYDKLGIFPGTVTTWSPGRIRGIGAMTGAAASATAPAPAYPSGIVAGDMLVLVCGGKPFNATVSTPAGWSAQGTTTNGSTASGTDTGSTLVAAFTKEAAGSESGSLTLTVTSGNSWWAQIIAIAKNDATDTWSVGTTTGTDTTSDTTFSAAMAADPGLIADDFAILCAVGSTDAAQTWTVPTLTATGITAQVNLLRGAYQPLITTGNDSGGMVGIVAVQSGPSTAAATWGATLSTGTNALFSAVLVRLRSMSLPARPVRLLSRAALDRASRW